MLEIIRQRRSVRKYLKKDVEDEKLNEILKAAMFAPTARGSRAWEFIIVRDEETKARLSEATPYSAFAKDAPVVIVICHDAGESKRFKEDSSLCAENIYLEATNQGLGTCFIQIVEGAEANEGDPEGFVKRTLSIPENIRVQCLMPIGYPEKQPEPHKDEEFDEGKVHHEKFSMRR
ncbi:MAG: nitroreductase family protein [Nitrospirota bacterium]